ncbi:MAG: hypothetical protein LBP59_11020 [Planctomycetaceae bacterium]|jgi:hypothetical protein|nr:hypothetical protein [Planctomycetaceae bacterium]
MSNIADISVFESLQSSQHDKMGMSSLFVFNEFTKKSDEALIQSIEARLKYLQKKSKPDDPADLKNYEREVAWTEGVLKAVKERLEKDEYKIKT